MMWNRYIRIVVILGMVAVMCGTVSAGMGISAETQTTSVGAYPVCTAPCECISESTAAIRWGAEGYEMCSKTVCGQSSDAMVQYYCIHQKGGTAAASKSVTTVTLATATTAVSAETAVNAPGTSSATPTVPALTSPAMALIATKTPMGIATLLAAIGAALLAAAGMRRK